MSLQVHAWEFSVDARRTPDANESFFPTPEGEELLGRPARSVLAKRCYEVMGGRFRRRRPRGEKRGAPERRDVEKHDGGKPNDQGERKRSGAATGSARSEQRGQTQKDRG